MPSGVDTLLRITIGDVSMDKTNKSKKVWYRNVWVWAGATIIVLLLVANWLIPGGLIR